MPEHSAGHRVGKGLIDATLDTIHAQMPFTLVGCKAVPPDPLDCVVWCQPFLHDLTQRFIARLIQSCQRFGASNGISPVLQHPVLITSNGFLARCFRQRLAGFE